MSKKFKKKVNDDEPIKKNVWENYQYLDKNSMDHSTFMSFLESDFFDSKHEIPLEILYKI